VPKLADKVLTDLLLQKGMKADKKPYEKGDAAVRGLSIRIAPSGLKTWLATKRVDETVYRITLGHYPKLSLAQARAEAAVVLNELRQGTHAKQKLGQGAHALQKSSGLFDDLFEDWLKRDQSDNRTHKEVERAMRKDVMPAWQGRKVGTITQSEITGLLNKVVDRGAETHANRLTAYIKRFFTWCGEQGVLDRSPADKLKAPKREISRDRVLSEDELAKVWKAATDTPYPFGPVFRLLILTGQRRNEVARAEWNEFDLEAGIWTIPASRAKNGQKHIVHLSDEALAILSGLPRLENSPFLFTTTGTTPVSGFSKAKEALDNASGVTDWRIHDLRRTFATITTGNLGVAPHVIDKVLNHVNGAVKGVAAVYQRAQYMDERRDAMEAWGEHLKSLNGQ